MLDKSWEITAKENYLSVCKTNSLNQVELVISEMQQNSSFIGLFCFVSLPFTLPQVAVALQCFSCPAMTEARLNIAKPLINTKHAIK